MSFLVPAQPEGLLSVIILARSVRSQRLSRKPEGALSAQSMEGASSVPGPAGSSVAGGKESEREPERERRKGGLGPAAREALGRPSSCYSTGPTPSDEGQGPSSEIRADDILFKVPKCRLCGLVTQVCLTLCKSLDCSLPGSLVHGISQANILEWAAISYSRGSSQPRD